MALYNQNYEAILLNSGNSYTGNTVTATTIHQLFCLSSGTINVTAIGGGSFIWSGTTSQSMDVLVGYCKTNTGQFVGFKSKYQASNIAPYYKTN
jgi:hypothetical protein